MALAQDNNNVTSVRVFALVAFQGATLNGKNESGEFHACDAN